MYKLFLKEGDGWEMSCYIFYWKRGIIGLFVFYFRGKVKGGKEEVGFWELEKWGRVKEERFVLWDL